MHRLRQKAAELIIDTKSNIHHRDIKPHTSPLKNSKSQSSFFNHSKSSIPLHDQQKRSLYKELELKYSPKSPRTVFRYDHNLTASLKLPVTDTLLEKNQHKIKRLFELSIPYTLEHAARRVDLFYYTLIAYHNTKLKPELGWTKLQHGRGRNGNDLASITQACHSSFTPSLIDSTLKQQIPVKTVDYENLTYKTSLICSTHFMDSLNSTLELPFFVNEFDTELETTYGCRQKALHILEHVANGKLNPNQGLHIFLLMMKNTFTEILKDKDFYKPIANTKDYLTAFDSTILKLRLHKLIEKGTLINKLDKNTNKVNEDYIFMLLRLKPEEIKLCKTDEKLKQKILAEKTLEIQKEIQTTPSEHVSSLKL